MSKEMKVLGLTLYLPDGEKLFVPGDQIVEMGQLPTGVPMVLWKTGDGKAKRAGGFPFVFELGEPPMVDVAGADALNRLPKPRLS